MCHVSTYIYSKENKHKENQLDQKQIRLIKDDTYKFVPGFLLVTPCFFSHVASRFKVFNWQ